jgi:hypothetical protein
MREWTNQRVVLNDGAGVNNGVSANSGAGPDNSAGHYDGAKPDASILRDNSRRMHKYRVRGLGQSELFYDSSPSPVVADADHNMHARLVC